MGGMMETGNIEYKGKFKDDSLKTARAFANSVGGTLRIGIKNNETPVGVEVSEEDPRKIVDKIMHKLEINPIKNQTSIIGNRVIGGNLFKQVNMGEKAIKNFINVRYEIKGLEREEIWDYPYSSVPRNPLIVHIFYLAGLIEVVGSGIGRMIESLKSQGLPEPEFKEKMGGFSVRFYKDIYTEENLRKMGLLEQQGTTGKGTFYVLVKNPQTAQTTHKGLTKNSKE